MDISAINGYFGTYMTVERSAAGASSDGVDFSKVLEAVSASDDNLDVSIDPVSSDSVTKYDSIFEKAAKTYQLPVSLLKAVAKQESNFNPSCVSSSGAMGMMQLMPKTAEGLGVTDPFAPEQNIMGGAKYLASMMERYHNDVSLALAAYNAGPGNVDKYGGIPPFEETKQYVKKVLKYAEAYGRSTDTKNSTSAQAASAASQVPKAAEESSIYSQYADWMSQMSMQSQWMALMSMNQNV
ncbi:MAG: lytic transglycosylase domain-containing protein [Clostridiales bacterium]|nr:lytic transglycosylase domain-containing protein [Clostridiales bacterium]